MLNSDTKNLIKNAGSLAEEMKGNGYSYQEWMSSWTSSNGDDQLLDEAAVIARQLRPHLDKILHGGRNKHFRSSYHVWMALWPQDNQSPRRNQRMVNNGLSNRGRLAGVSPRRNAMNGCAISPRRNAQRRMAGTSHRRNAQRR